MKITKTQLRKIIKEEMDSFEVLGKLIRIRQSIRNADGMDQQEIEEMFKSLDEDLSLIIKELPSILSK
tara:strand:- start:56 stop:259 length:204 start_codon:yes stop_codon:yes gene_type:complete